MICRLLFSMHVLQVKMSFYLRFFPYIIKQVKCLSFFSASQRSFITISPSLSKTRHWNQHELTNTCCDLRLFQQRWFFSSRPLLELVTVNCPAFADSISERDVKWERAVGDIVSVDEIVVEIETDKTTLPIHSPVAGVMKALLVEDGTAVTSGTPLFQVNTKGDNNDKTADISEKSRKCTEVSSQPTRTKEEKSDFNTNNFKIVHGSEGFAMNTMSRLQHRIKMNRMRLRISQRLKNSQNTAAMLTTFNEVDMSNIKDMRNKYKESFLKKHGVKLTFMSAFIKASAYALQLQPVMNAVIDDTSHEVVYRDFVDISVAVSTGKGLVVPVIRNCENMNYLDLEREMTNLATKARNNDLTIEEMNGGTFTISNGGAFGSMFSTPIINLPQSAILGMHGVFDRPVAVKGEVKIRPMMYVALTYDHRLIDGKEAVTFLKKIKEAVEDPRIIFLEL